MTVLVDAAVWPARGRYWCHLVSNASFDELHAFATEVGLPAQAFHRDHYDVPADRRDEVLRAGAREVTARDLVRELRVAGLRRGRM